MIDLDRIEAVARAAQERSPGPWRTVGYHGEVCWIMDSAPKPDTHDGSTWEGNTVLETDGGYYEPKGATAVHIATCSPDVVLKLVARIRELEAREEDAIGNARAEDK